MSLFSDVFSLPVHFEFGGEVVTTRGTGRGLTRVLTHAFLRDKVLAEQLPWVSGVVRQYW